MRPARLRLRRRLLLVSAPVALVAVLAAVKLLSSVVAGEAAVSAYHRQDADTLRRAVAVLGVADVVEPAKTLSAAGSLAVLDGRLADAETAFAGVLARTAHEASCPVRVDLELVREALGDRAADPAAATAHYTGALAVVDEAPPNCFAGNADPDPQRRTVRADSRPRLTAKIGALSAPPPPPVALPPAPPPPPPPPPPTVGSGADENRGAPRPLDPGRGDPLDRLRQVMQDAQEAAG